MADKEPDADTVRFLTLADKFITLANSESDTEDAANIHMPFLYAAARYNAFVAKAVLNVSDQEHFIDQITEDYANMLRQHLADPGLGGGNGSGGNGSEKQNGKTASDTDDFLNS